MVDAASNEYYNFLTKSFHLQANEPENTRDSIRKVNKGRLRFTGIIGLCNSFAPTFSCASLKVYQRTTRLLLPPVAPPRTR